MIVSKILLTRGKVALIDPEDFDLVGGYAWRCAQDDGRLEYAVTTATAPNGTRYTARMHSLILDALKGQRIDHVNGNGLDNRRENLRFADDRRNQANQHSVRGRSQYKGVYLKGGRWCAKIKGGGRQQHLGYFKDEVDAAIAYDQAALKMHGGFANPNFPRRVHERLAWVSLEVVERARDVIVDWEQWASRLDIFPPDDLLEWSRRSLEELPALDALKGVK